jgi:hypothetical protein
MACGAAAALAAGAVRAKYKKPLTDRAKGVMRPDQGQKSQSLEWEETKPERISNIQANLGGCRGGSESTTEIKLA